MVIRRSAPPQYPTHILDVRITIAKRRYSRAVAQPIPLPFPTSVQSSQQRKHKVREQVILSPTASPGTSTQSRAQASSISVNLKLYSGYGKGKGFRDYVMGMGKTARMLHSKRPFRCSNVIDLAKLSEHSSSYGPIKHPYRL